MLTPPEVRAVYVVDADGALTGVLTRKTLVAKVVAAGLDPGATAIGAIAEEPYYTIDADTPLDEAFRFLEEHDAERVPVVERGPAGRRALAQRPAAPPRRGRASTGSHGRPVGARLASPWPVGAVRRRREPCPYAPAGGMFWLCRKTFSGSYVALILVSRW